MKKFIYLISIILLTSILPSFALDVTFTPDQMTVFGGAQNGGNHIGYLDNPGSGFFVTYTSPQRQWVTVKLLNFNAKDQVANINQKILVNNQEMCSFTNNNPEYTAFTAGTILLQEGVNEIKIETNTAINWVNYQGLVLTNFQIDNETAYSIYEAENATLLGGATVHTNHSGYSGTGFVDNLGAADGTGVSFLVNAIYEGEYTLDFRYTSISNQKISLYINTSKITQANLPTTSEGSSSWEVWGTWSTKVFLKQGENNITFKRDIGDYTQINIDNITLRETIGTVSIGVTSGTTLTGYICNNTAKTVNGLAIIALYEGNTVKGVYTKQVLIEPRNYTGIETTLSCIESNNVKMFFWDSVNGMIPYTQLAKASYKANNDFNQTYTVADLMKTTKNATAKFGGNKVIVTSTADNGGISLGDFLVDFNQKPVIDFEMFDTNQNIEMQIKVDDKTYIITDAVEQTGGCLLSVRNAINNEITTGIHNVSISIYSAKSGETFSVGEMILANTQKYQNPYLPLNEYIPDGEPRVFGDRVYIYGSHDDYSGNYFCSNQLRVYSASVNDLSVWIDLGVSFTSTGEGDGVPWSDALLYAPDVIEKDGIYYLYFCLSDGSEGVATSPNPQGPFTEAKRMYYPNGTPLSNIDPAAFVDDDGSVYYLWGQFNLQIAKLASNMVDLDESTYNNALITDVNSYFHEGSSLRKIGDTYYLIYCSTITGRANNLDYATSKNPLGPYTRQGTIINNLTIDPQSWNNHGSIACINGQWYIFYHGSSNNGVASRRARVEKIYIDETGKIEQVNMTSQGFGESLNPYSITSAATACDIGGGNYSVQYNEFSHGLKNNVNMAYAGYKYFDFGSEEKPLILEAKLKNAQAGQINVRLDNITGKIIGRIDVSKDGKTYSNINKISGNHAIYLEFITDSEGLCDLEWFRFLPQS